MPTMRGIAGSSPISSANAVCSSRPPQRLASGGKRRAPRRRAARSPTRRGTRPPRGRSRRTRRQARSSLVAARLSEGRVPADVRDQEGQNARARSGRAHLGRLCAGHRAFPSATAARARCEFALPVVPALGDRPLARRRGRRSGRSRSPLAAARSIAIAPSSTPRAAELLARRARARRARTPSARGGLLAAEPLEQRVGRSPPRAQRAECTPGRRRAPRTSIPESSPSTHTSGSPARARTAPSARAFS